MKIYKVTNAQLKTLLEKGSITVGGTTYDYNSEDVYVVTDGFPEYRLNVNNDRKDIVQLNKDGVVVATATVNNVAFATKSNSAQLLTINGTDVETVNTIRQKTVAPLVTADTVLTADLAQNIVAVGYFETGTDAANERWFVIRDTTTDQDYPALEAFRWDAYDTTIVYTADWDLNSEWGRAEVIDFGLITDVITDKKLDKVTTVDTTKLYMKNADGTQGMIALSQSASSNSVVHRDANGKSQIATPTDSDSVKSITNVEYVKNYVTNNSSKLKLTDNKDGTVTLNIV